MEKNLAHLIAPALQVLGFELVNCTFVSEFGRRTLRVLIDSPNGVTIDQCTQASRQINAILEAEANITTAYDLEVSSAGLNRPLITLAHFQQFIGREAKITLHQALDERKNFTGKILATTDKSIQILVDDKTFDLNFDNIEKAQLVFATETQKNKKLL